MTTPNPTHEPYRGSDVEAWIKRHRDQYSHGDEHWTTLDDLLDAYRNHVYTGTPLTEWAPSGPGDDGREDTQ